MENEIVSIKLTTAEEVVAKLIKIEECWVVVDKPMVLSATPQGFTFIPLVVTATKTMESTVDINMKNVLTWPKHTDKDIASNYIEATTGIHLI